ncbi:hypothetical protein [Blastococcus sp. CT_GayMR16]|uniref:hypothetical protein n=1 Tax=Blastococcus sp. CT_GayMR16 TaxID=2559607 RepID=UPI00107400C3|nr:hypothetical protein [Blastococcus sp. CT_GayMR16]TFV91441.1 hypothetical protein E4P38_02330 [Blastococcus sp. CT_GayMR16]
MQLTSTPAQVSSDDVQEFFLQRGWSDGLPVVPPTPDRVAAFVAAVGRRPGDVLARIPEQAREVTVEKLAINAVMAGARAEYMDVLVAAVVAMGRPRYNLHSTTVSGATAPLLIVSGPVVQRIALNSRFSLFGPGHHANATIGRAIRLLQQNVCGGRPGVVDKATFGHPGKYSYCIAEDAAASPWEPVHADRGVDPAGSAVTVYAGEAPIMARNDWSSDAGPVLDTIADAMLPSHFTGGGCTVVVGPLHAAAMARAGLSRADVAEELFRRARRTLTSLRRAGRLSGPVGADEDTVERTVVPRPEDILVLVAGGHLYGYSAVVPAWIGGHESMAVTVPLDLATAPDLEGAVADLTHPGAGGLPASPTPGEASS